MKQSWMKKIGMTLALALTLNAAAPAPRAEAGVAMLIASSACEPLSGGEATLQVFGGLLTLGGVISFFVMIGGPSDHWPVATAALVLDADASQSKDVLAEMFSKKYPFVDNAETFSELASALKTKPVTLSNDGKLAYASLTEDETRAALEASNLTDAQIEQIAADLK